MTVFRNEERISSCQRLENRSGVGGEGGRFVRELLTGGILKRAEGGIRAALKLFGVCTVVLGTKTHTGPTVNRAKYTQLTDIQIHTTYTDTDTACMHTPPNTHTHSTYTYMCIKTHINRHITHTYINRKYTHIQTHTYKHRYTTYTCTNHRYIHTHTHKQTHHMHTHTYVVAIQAWIGKEFLDTEGVSLLRAKSRDNEGAANTAGRPPARSDRANPFCGLIANFYSLKTKKIPARRVALGD